ncbi:hypothetical protein V502_05309, partial [Pseudogymnoascus sp. VKM F-4520 (FW-2644)]
RGGERRSRSPIELTGTAAAAAGDDDAVLKRAANDPATHERGEEAMASIEGVPPKRKESIVDIDTGERESKRIKSGDKDEESEEGEVEDQLQAHLDKAPPTITAPSGAPLQTTTTTAIPHAITTLTMSLDPPTYLSSLRNNIRARPIPWDGAVRAGTITEEQLGRIRAVDKVRKELRKRTVEEEVGKYTSLFLGGEGGEKSILEKAARRADVVQQPGFGRWTGYKPRRGHPPPNIHGTHDPPCQGLGHEPQRPASERPSAANPIQIPEHARQEHGQRTPGHRSDGVLVAAAEQTVARAVLGAQRCDCGAADCDFADCGGGVGEWGERGVVVEWWCDGEDGGGGLSFEGAAIGDGLEDEYDVIPLFTQLLRLSPKEKTTRLLVSTLYNLISGNPKSLLPAAALVRLPTLLQNVTGRHLTDPDLIEDLTALSELLEEHTKTQTTFDQYAAEVDSGHLRWSPPHRNTVFWAENARRILEHENGHLPKKLAEIIAKPWDNDKQVLAIVCNDVGCLVKEVPEKRQQLERLGLKTRIMELMAEPDESVRWESLRAVGEWLRYSFETK